MFFWVGPHERWIPKALVEMGVTPNFINIRLQTFSCLHLAFLHFDTSHICRSTPVHYHFATLSLNSLSQLTHLHTLALMCSHTLTQWMGYMPLIIATQNRPYRSVKNKFLNFTYRQDKSVLILLGFLCNGGPVPQDYFESVLTTNRTITSMIFSFSFKPPKLPLTFKFKLPKSKLTLQKLPCVNQDCKRIGFGMDMSISSSVSYSNEYYKTIPYLNHLKNSDFGLDMKYIYGCCHGSRWNKYEVNS